MGGESTVLEINPVPPISKIPFLVFKNLRENKNLLRNLVSRDFKVNYHGHFLGYFWSLLEPLALTGIFFLVFVILRGDTDITSTIEDYDWNPYLQDSFSRTLSQCTSCLVSNSSLIQQV